MIERRPVNRRLLAVCVGEPVEEIPDEGQPAAPLVVKINECPRRMLGMRRFQHRLTRRGVVGVMGARRLVDRRQLPSLQRVGDPFRETLFLLGLVAGQPIFEQRMPSSISIFSNGGTATKNASTWLGVAKPITLSTPARLYQLRSNRVIWPLSGRCWMKR